MKTIIKKGKLRHYKHICLNCGCEFSYDETDIHLDRMFPLKTVVSCPMCEREEDNIEDKLIEEDN